jgi:formylglycine-generating enzyme required for sulfatase activity
MPFRLGSDTEKFDEKPARQVTLSPFAIGKFEITNAQYEQFKPDHRKFRDEYSWRDADPVIYVSWNNTAQYCNWLSTQAGLDPVYDEKTWMMKPGANGYRLPSEAQWEYVASGRGEGWKYPWGNEEPTPDRGNFSLEKSLDLDDALHAHGVQSATPVGSYEKGASKDGVMDLAGNVSEWNGDVYDTYPATPGTDPVVDKADPRYRVIRGGSWGYYNYSQEVRHREFNNPGYPGYIYLGLRVALPQAGWEKVKTKQ